jgi:hypothetical protein
MGEVVPLYPPLTEMMAASGLTEQELGLYGDFNKKDGWYVRQCPQCTEPSDIAFRHDDVHSRMFCTRAQHASGASAEIVVNRALERRDRNRLPSPLAEAIKPKGRFDLKSFSSITLRTDRRHLIPDILPAKGVVVLGGAWKDGKTFVLIDVLQRVGAGFDFRGRHVEQGPAIYFAAEDPVGVEDRIIAWRQAFLGDEAPELEAYMISDRLDLANDVDELIARIRDQLALPPLVVAIDTLNKTIGGDENSPADMTAYVQAAGHLSRELDCLVIIVHHFGHNGGRLRGHSSLPAGVDAELWVSKDDETGIITLTVKEMRNGPSGTTIASRLKVVEIGRADGGQPITSCVLEEAGSPAAESEAAAKAAKPKPAATTKPKLEPLALKFHAALIDALANPNNTDLRTKGDHRGTILNRWIDELVRRGHLDRDRLKSNSQRATLSKYKNQLLAAEWIGIDDEVWVYNLKVDTTRLL